jgi:hypothetical protein
MVGPDVKAGHRPGKGEAFRAHEALESLYVTKGPSKGVGN